MKKDFATWREEIMCVRSRQAQEAFIMELFRYQAKHNALYSSYLSHVGREAEKSKGMEDIVYLPLQFFRSHEVKTGDWKEERRFLSSGTTDSQRSVHAIDDTSFYVHHAQRIFERYYGLLKELCLIVYLPNYEHSTSSLICMLKHFVSCAHTLSGFVSNAEMLADKVDAISRSYKGNKVLWGVTFALLEASRVLRGLDLSDYLLIETGGMKREEDGIEAGGYASLLEGMLELSCDSYRIWDDGDAFTGLWGIGANGIFRSYANMCEGARGSFCFGIFGQCGGDKCY